MCIQEYNSQYKGFCAHVTKWIKLEDRLPPILVAILTIIIFHSWYVWNYNTHIFTCNTFQEENKFDENTENYFINNKILERKKQLMSVFDLTAKFDIYSRTHQSCTSNPFHPIPILAGTWMIKSKCPQMRLISLARHTRGPKSTMGTTPEVRQRRGRTIGLGMLENSLGKVHVWVLWLALFINIPDKTLGVILSTKVLYLALVEPACVIHVTTVRTRSSKTIA